MVGFPRRDRITRKLRLISHSWHVDTNIEKLAKDTCENSGTLEHSEACVCTRIEGLKILIATRVLQGRDRFWDCGTDKADI